MKSTHQEITVGELGNEGNNSEVLKELYNIKKTQEDLNQMIQSLDTKIKLR